MDDSPTARPATDRSGSARPPTFSCSISMRSIATRSWPWSLSISSSPGRPLRTWRISLSRAGRSSATAGRPSSTSKRPKRRSSANTARRSRRARRFWKPGTISSPRSRRITAPASAAAEDLIMAKALPIIDLSSWSGGGAAAAEVVKAIGAACRDVGFFYVVGHGVPTTLMDEAFAQSCRFFALPLAAKEAIAIETVGGNRGYSALMHEALDPSRGPDLKEAFNVGFELQPDDPEFLAGKPFRSLNAWPRLAGFRETMLAYYDACAALGARLHQAFAGDLGVAPDFFADKFDRPMATLRLLRYPAAAEERIGAGAHTDYGNLTLLACRRPRSAHPRRRLDRGPAARWSLHRQYRRLPDAMDERRLCLDPAPRRQPQRPRTLFHRLLFRPQSRSCGRRDSLLHRPRRSRPLPADPRRRLPQAPPRREPARRPLRRSQIRHRSSLFKGLGAKICNSRRPRAVLEQD